MKQFLKQLLGIRSSADYPDNITSCMQLFADAATERGLAVHWSTNPLYVIIGRGDLKQPEIGIIAHVDVIEPFFEPREENDTLFGRGAMDMKGPATAAFFAMLDSTHQNVAMVITGDEEVGGAVAKHLCDVFVPSHDLIVPDQNRDFRITLESKGALHFSVAVNGKEGHGAKPWSGTNAIEQGFALFDQLKNTLYVNNTDGWHNTLALAFVDMNNRSHNVIPGSARFAFDFRFVSKTPEHWQEIISDIASHYGRYEEKIAVQRIELAKTSELERYKRISEEELGRGVEYAQNFGSCDARHWMGRVPTIILTRPIGSASHVFDEHVEYPSLETLKKIIERFLNESQNL